MTFDELKNAVQRGDVDTVLACVIDMQGRLMGKRFVAEHFIESAWEETHCCDYLLATDLEMATPDGYASTSWEKGYGDYVMRPDLATLRPVPWLDGTVLVLCDILNHHTHAEVPMSPRAMLKRQIKRAKALGFTPMLATELEFFIFAQSFDALRRDGYRSLEPFSGYNEDYNIFQTTKEEPILRPVRNHLRAMGVPVEGSKGEAEAGQQELNIRYAEAMATAEHHTIAKHALKEIAWQQGHAVTFLPKWDQRRVGSSAHIHQSLWCDGANAFHDPAGTLGMSRVMEQYMAGLLAYSPDITYLLAPYINSYKRFAKGTFAPTKIVWSVDNRTAAYRLCGEGTKAIRVECRIGGSDLNPYLAFTGILAAGLAGIEQGLLLPPAAAGDAYQMAAAPDIPRTLAAATAAFSGSAMLKVALGEDVVAHYTRCACWEMEEFERVVTDYEIARGFERA